MGPFSTRFFDVETIVWTPLKAVSDGVRLFLLNDSLRAGIRAIDHTHPSCAANLAAVVIFPAHAPKRVLAEAEQTPSKPTSLLGVTVISVFISPRFPLTAQ